MNMTCVSSNILSPKMSERVVWHLRDTSATFNLTRELRRCDLPPLGAPTMAMLSRLRSLVVFVVVLVDASSWTGGMLACMQVVLE